MSEKIFCFSCGGMGAVLWPSSGMVLNILQHTRQSSTPTKNYLNQNANTWKTIEVEKFWPTHLYHIVLGLSREIGPIGCVWYIESTDVCLSMERERLGSCEVRTDKRSLEGELKILAEVDVTVLSGRTIFPRDLGASVLLCKVFNGFGWGYSNYGGYDTLSEVHWFRC